MSIYITKKDNLAGQSVVVEDMLLTTDMPTTAGSKMLDGYMSLFEAEVITRLKNAGYEIGGKANVGEFAIDLLGETSYFGSEYFGGILKSPSAEIIKNGDASAVIGLDVNGAIRRAACQNKLYAIKPTYGTVSRYGTIPVACSGETVSVMANSVEACRKMLGVIAGHDDKDGTSLSDKAIADGKAGIVKKNKVAVVNGMLSGISDGVKANIDLTVKALQSNGVQVDYIDTKNLEYSGKAWNILMSAELCNNVSRYDGVKYGYRAKNFTGIDELYVNSRTQAFGELLKTAILFGSETLSTENYKKVYDKALRVRRVILEELNGIFAEYDCVIMPACSVESYDKATVEGDKYLCYKENFYTAPASITGLPTVAVGGALLVGKAFADELLLDLASVCQKEGL